MSIFVLSRDQHTNTLEDTSKFGSSVKMRVGFYGTMKLVKLHFDLTYYSEVVVKKSGVNLKIVKLDLCEHLC